ncbi:MAG: DUF1287 domain-containing protein [Verrucomicrobia bacterium]|nr:DUF1287 domain-containing protein [Verrucomicrobiota bacterium]
MRLFALLLLAGLLVQPLSAQESAVPATTPSATASTTPVVVAPPPPSPENAEKIRQLIAAARQQIGVTTKYDPDYSQITFPNGDVPLDRGVCTDVIVRALRAVGADLQVLVNEDMKRAWARYPKLWNLSAPDPNIDHRRVPNLMIYLMRAGKRKRNTQTVEHYPPGDFVVWKLPNGLLHIGLVSDAKSPAGTPLVIHNIGAGTKEEDILFQYEIIGHYRWFGEEPVVKPATTPARLTPPSGPPSARPAPEVPKPGK